MLEPLIWAAVLVAFAALAWWGRKRARGRPGTASVGAFYDMLNEDKRNAIEIVVEGRAEARDPETADGNLPDLERGSRGVDD